MNPPLEEADFNDVARVHDVLRVERLREADQITELTQDFDGMVAAARSSNSDDEHDPEGATIAFERAQVVAVLRLAQRRLAEIDQALARLGAGTYGSCERCERPIGRGRLQARPAASTCVSCARAEGQ